jgi:hypothetical protein
MPHMTTRGEEGYAESGFAVMFLDGNMLYFLQFPEQGMNGNPGRLTTMSGDVSTERNDIELFRCTSKDN